MCFSGESDFCCDSVFPKIPPVALPRFTMQSIVGILIWSSISLALVRTLMQQIWWVTCFMWGLPFLPFHHSPIQNHPFFPKIPPPPYIRTLYTKSFSGVQTKRYSCSSVAAITLCCKWKIHMILVSIDTLLQKNTYTYNPNHPKILCCKWKYSPPPQKKKKKKNTHAPTKNRNSSTLKHPIYFQNLIARLLKISANVGNLVANLVSLYPLSLHYAINISVVCIDNQSLPFSSVHSAFCVPPLHTKKQTRRKNTICPIYLFPFIYGLSICCSKQNGIIRRHDVTKPPYPEPSSTSFCRPMGVSLSRKGDTIAVREELSYQ